MLDEKEALKRQIRALEKRLHCAFVETQMYKVWLADLRRELSHIKFYLDYRPDKDKELQKSIWGYK